LNRSIHQSIRYTAREVTLVIMDTLIVVFTYFYLQRQKQRTTNESVK